MKYSDLEKHPEGGRFMEVFRSPRQVTAGDMRRSALTHIYFALEGHEFSSFHRVESDEVWNLYDGDGVILHVFHPGTETVTSHELSSRTGEYCLVVPAGAYQAAEPVSGPVLAGCSVAPGFEFEDFTLLREGTGPAGIIRKQYPGLVKFIRGGNRG